MIFNLFGKRKKEKEPLQKQPQVALKRKETSENIKRQREAFKKDRLIDNFEWRYIDEIQSLSFPTKRSFEVLADSKVIESDFFLIKEKEFVCFADRTNNKAFENYIAENTENIKAQLSSKGWNFIHIPPGNNVVEEFNLSYFFPFANWDDRVLNELKHIEMSKTIGNQIVDFYQYDGPAKTGFIFCVQNKFVFIAKKEEEPIADFVQQYLAYMPPSMPRQYAFPPEYDLELDSDTAQFIYQIKINLDKLKENGQFFAIAPTLLKIIEEASRATPKISRMLIDRDYRILLPDYQNREIKLSHLTKSLYLLLLKHPKGVYFLDFKLYEKELFEIYKKVSNRVDLDKMRESIAELGNGNEKNIRIHVSRIKSAFAKEFSDLYASKYYVIGGEVRAVLLDRKLLSWEAALLYDV